MESDGTERVREIAALLDKSGDTLTASELSDLLDQVFAVFAVRESVLPQEVRERAIAVLGSPRAADSWLRQTHALLDGRAPVEVLKNHDGREQVLDLLGRIEFGTYS